MTSRIDPLISSLIGAFPPPVARCGEPGGGGFASCDILTAVSSSSRIAPRAVVGAVPPSTAIILEGGRTAIVVVWRDRADVRSHGRRDARRADAKIIVVVVMIVVNCKPQRDIQFRGGARGSSIQTIGHASPGSTTGDKPWDLVPLTSGDADVRHCAHYCGGFSLYRMIERMDQIASYL